MFELYEKIPKRIQKKKKKKKIPSKAKSKTYFKEGPLEKKMRLPEYLTKVRTSKTTSIVTVKIETGQCSPNSMDNGRKEWKGLNR